MKRVEALARIQAYSWSKGAVVAAQQRFHSKLWLRREDVAASEDLPAILSADVVTLQYDWTIAH